MHARLLVEADTVDRQARQIVFTYDPRGNLLSRTDPSGTATWNYDAAGRLVQEVDADGRTTSYERDGLGRVVKQSGPHPEAVWTYAYDSIGRLEHRSLGSPATATWSYLYGPLPGQMEETDPLLRKTQRQFNARGQLTQESRGSGLLVRAWEYDGSWLAKETVAEGTWLSERTATYDDRGRPQVERERWTGTAPTWAYEYQTTTSWSGRTATITQQRSGFTFSRTAQVDSLGNVVSVTSDGLTDEWRYDAAGLLVWEQPAGQARTSYSYVAGLLTEETLSGTGMSETTTYGYFADGRPASVLDPSGRTRSFTWTPGGLLASETYGIGSELERTNYTYDPGGTLASMWRGGDTSATWTYDHGPRGELRSVTQPGGIGTFSYSYDGALQLTEVTPPLGSALPATTYTYDPLGRMQTKSRGTSTWTNTYLNGWVDSLSPTGGVERTLADGRARRVRQIRQAGFGDWIDLTEVDYAYGFFDEPLSIVETRQSGDVTVSFGYDNRRRLTSESRSGQITTYAYSPGSDRLASLQSPAGTTTRSYDDLGRVESLSSSVTTQFGWEAGGERLVSIEGAGLSERRCYDGAGRISSIIHNDGLENCGSSPASPISRFDYTYDARGNRSSETYTDPSLFPFTELTEYGYDAADRLSGVRYGEGGSFLYQLDGSGTRLQELRFASSPYVGGLEPQAFAAAALLADEELSYNHNLRGGLAGISSLLGAATTYVTDASGRMTSESRGGQTREFTWDGERLISITQGGDTLLENLYDHAGRRVERLVGQDTTTYHWSGRELVGETTGPSTSAHYQRLGGFITARGDARVLHDAHGSVAGLTSTLDTALYRHDAWGSYRSHRSDPTAWPQPEESTPGYAGQYWDSTAGLSYAEQRWYNPELGQFLSEDPFDGVLVEPVSTNPFLYAHSNPARWTDPTGEAVPVILIYAALTTIIGWEAHVIHQELTEGKDLLTADHWEALKFGLASGAIVYSGGTFGLSATGMLYGAGAGFDVAGQMLVGGRSFGELDFGSVHFSGGLSTIAGLGFARGLGSGHALIRGGTAGIGLGLTGLGVVGGATILADGIQQGDAGKVVFGAASMGLGAFGARSSWKATGLEFRFSGLGSNFGNISIGLSQSGRIRANVAASQLGRKAQAEAGGWSRFIARSEAIGQSASPASPRGAGIDLNSSFAAGGAQTAQQGFRSFSSFKRAMGPAGPNKHWHHIVEKTPGNLQSFGAEAIHNTGNLVRVDAGVHTQISAYYSRIQPFTGGRTVRQWLSTQALEAQTQFGLQVLRDFGVQP